MIGFRPKTREYGERVDRVELERDGEVFFANWLHPSSARYTPNQEEIEELRKFVKPGDVCIDIGANTGDTAFPMAIAAGRTGTVFALEPNPYCNKITAINAALNKDKTHIIALPFAATPEDCEMEFEYSDPGYCNGGRHENINKWIHGHAFKLQVTGRNLVSYLEENHPSLVDKIIFIKVDTEGFDLSVLRSLTDIIKRARPHIRAEVFKKSNRRYRREMYRFFKDCGYNVYHFESPVHYQGVELKEADMTKWKHFDIYARPQELDK